CKQLSRFPRKATLRIPIQWNKKTQQMEDPASYVPALEALSRVADIMLCFADSSAMKHFGTAQDFENHVVLCLRALRRYATIAEAGNEVNGNWLGTGVEEKVRRALDACNGAKLPAAVTYYLSADAPDQMFEWIRQHPLPGTSYSLISHYPNTT